MPYHVSEETVRIRMGFATSNHIDTLAIEATVYTLKGTFSMLLLLFGC